MFPGPIPCSASNRASGTCNEMTMKEIGGVLGINESRVSQIHKSALEKMANVLESNGISSAFAFAD